MDRDSLSHPPHRRTWGFRFFATDAIVLLVVAAGAALLRAAGNDLWWLLLIVAAHFFLFCNVFRIRRRFEFLWALSFLVNTGTWLALEQLTWMNVLLVQLPVTAALIAAALRTRSYHGIFARRINPNLNDYLNGSTD